MSKNKYEMEIKQQFIKQFANAFDLIVSEISMPFSTQVGSSWFNCRADLFGIKNNMHILAIEIKSKFDSLKRLPIQLKCYSENCNMVMLIVDIEHFHKDIACYVEILNLCNRNNAIFFIYQNKNIVRYDLSEMGIINDIEVKTIENHNLSHYWNSLSLYKMFSKSMYKNWGVNEMRQEIAKLPNEKLHEETIKLLKMRYEHENLISHEFQKRNCDNQTHYVNKDICK